MIRKIIIFLCCFQIACSVGCAVEGPKPAVSIKNFENRDHCDLQHEYLWVSLTWKMK
jgi:hypothetical protein